ncbi:hypothetical protein N9934_00860 [Desulfosarcina sp.]|nr:hypothetical protein [Desulfosarcina sp.]
MKKTILISILSFLLFVNLGWSQNTGKEDSVLSPEEIENYKLDVSNLVTYLEGTLNFLGDPNSVPREKEIIINNSYLKMFKDDKVQIEDDLDEKREVSLHKDVQAYLKDVMFFFKEVSFQFIVVDVSHFVTEQGDHYFTATFNRDLNGITIDGDTVNSRRVRYMEVNLDVGKNDLRIASIYSTKLNQREEIRNWWNGLSTAWRQALASDIIICDSIKLAEVIFIGDSLLLISDPPETEDADSTSKYVLDLPDEKRISSDVIPDTVFDNTGKIYTPLSGILKHTELNLSGNHSIRDLTPIIELTELDELDLSNTIITDLFPLRNLNKLKSLDISNTPVDDISSIRYNTSIEELNCSFTLIQNLDEIGGLYNLTNLNCAGNRISEFQFLTTLPELQLLDCSETQLQEMTVLNDLTNLEYIDISGTRIRKIKSLSNLKKVKYLNCDNTSISSVEPITELDSLEVLKISHTAVDDISILKNLTVLKRIYWDGNDAISVEEKRAAAIKFMKDSPETLVIFESDALTNGWNQLEEPWKKKLGEVAGLGDSPTKEELHTLLKIEEIDMTGISITTLNPVRHIYNLQALNISGIQVEDYSPLEEALELKKLNVSGTLIMDLEVLKSLNKLETLNIENTQVSSLSPLEGKKQLELVYADSSKISDDEVFSFSSSNPTCVVIYKSEEMTLWWNGLSEPWKDYFSGSFKLSSPPSTEQLHKILLLDELNISDQNGIKSLAPINILLGLKILRLKNLPVSDISPLSSLTNLEVIECIQIPLNDLAPLSGLRKVTELNIENTTVSDLKPITGLGQIQKLKISGTQIKSLKPIADYNNLEEIELNNTPVKSIKVLVSLTQLKSVECYNTKITSKNIEGFKEDKPDCKVVYY